MPYIFPVGEGCMVSFLAANSLEKQLLSFYPRLHISYVFEFRVEDGKDQVDLAMAISEKEDLQFFKIYFDKTHDHKKVGIWFSNCIALQEKEQAIKSFWIEADLDGSEQDQIPSLFISPKQKSITLAEMTSFFEVLNLQSLNNKNQEFLKQCINALEDSQYIEHFGVMHSRGDSKTTRMYIRGFEKDSLLLFLHKINWPGDKEVLIKQFEGISMVSYISVAIEFNDVWLPTIGIEFHLKKGIEYSDAFLHKLKTSGFCTERRVAAIRDILCPKKIKSGKFTYKRSLSHFKITLGRAKKIEPKVYVQLTPNYLGVMGF